MPALPFAAEARRARRSAHPRAADERAEGRRDDGGGRSRTIKAMRAALEANAATAPKLNKATATRAADATASAPRGDHRVVQLLQRLRPAVHVVGGDAVQAARRGAAGLRDVPARQGRGGRRAGAARRRPACRRFSRRRRRSTPRCPTSRRSSRCRRTRLRDIVGAVQRRAAAAAAAADAAARRRRRRCQPRPHRRRPTTRSTPPGSRR